MTRYSQLQIANHWITALLILFMAATGLAYGYKLAGKEAIIAHQIAGQILILVIAVRLVARLLRPPKDVGPQHAAWERRTAHVVHILLYVVVLAYLVTGYVSASALGTPSLLAPVSQAFARSDTGEILLEVHYALKLALGALLVLHIGGALKHLVVDRDGTFANMWFTSR